MGWPSRLNLSLRMSTRHGSNLTTSVATNSSCANFPCGVNCLLYIAFIMSFVEIRSDQIQLNSTKIGSSLSLVIAQVIRPITTCSHHIC